MDQILNAGERLYTAKIESLLAITIIFTSLLVALGKMLAAVKRPAPHD